MAKYFTPPVSDKVHRTEVIKFNKHKYLQHMLMIKQLHVHHSLMTYSIQAMLGTITGLLWPNNMLPCIETVLLQLLQINWTF